EHLPGDLPGAGRTGPATGGVGPGGGAVAQRLGAARGTGPVAGARVSPLGPGVAGAGGKRLPADPGAGGGRAGGAALGGAAPTGRRGRVPGLAAAGVSGGGAGGGPAGGAGRGADDAAGTPAAGPAARVKFGAVVSFRPGERTDARISLAGVRGPG